MVYELCALSCSFKKQTYEVERKGKIPTGIASLSHTEAERDKKSEKQILSSEKNMQYIRRDKSVVKSINTRSEN